MDDPVERQKGYEFQLTDILVRSLTYNLENERQEIPV